MHLRDKSPVTNTLHSNIFWNWEFTLKIWEVLRWRILVIHENKFKIAQADEGIHNECTIYQVMVSAGNFYRDSEQTLSQRRDATRSRGIANSTFMIKPRKFDVRRQIRTISKFLVCFSPIRQFFTLRFLPILKRRRGWIRPEQVMIRRI